MILYLRAKTMLREKDRHLKFFFTSTILSLVNYIIWCLALFGNFIEEKNEFCVRLL